MNWGAVANAHHYDVRMRVQGTSTWSIVLNNLTGTSIIKTGLTSSTTYEWAIRSACSADSSSVSAWSATQSRSSAASDVYKRQPLDVAVQPAGVVIVTL